MSVGYFNTIFLVPSFSTLCLFFYRKVKYIELCINLLYMLKCAHVDNLSSYVIANLAKPPMYIPNLGRDGIINLLLQRIQKKWRKILKYSKNNIWERSFSPLFVLENDATHYPLEWSKLHSTKPKGITFQAIE